MGQALGWQRMSSGSSHPFVRGRAWVDSVTRVGNVVTYSINFCMSLERNGYWNYIWYVDMQIGTNASNNRKVKNATSGYLGTTEYYQSVFNGNYTGSITVSGKASKITLKAKFHDSYGNTGPDCYWDIGIPEASSMDDIRAEVSDITTDSATVSAAITKAGNYSTINSWKIEYGVDDYSEHTDTKSVSDLSVSWDLSSLSADTAYKYRITVTSTSGYSKEYTGVFNTIEEDIGYKVITGENVELTGWIIYPDGTLKKIKEIRTV